MCNLCSQDPHEKRIAVAHAERIAATLFRLSKDYERMAHGQIKLHEGKEIQDVAARARDIVRELVNEFI